MYIYIDEVRELLEMEKAVINLPATTLMLLKKVKGEKGCGLRRLDHNEKNPR